MLFKVLSGASLALFLLSCGTKQEPAIQQKPLTEISALYTSPTAEMMYSENVNDSFQIFSSVPSAYSEDSARYPLILLVDANAYFEPVLAEFKLGTLTQGYPNSVLVGVGYKDFATLDSLRDRDYTFPVAPAKDSFAVSGGGERFRQFIDDELLPVISKKFRVDENNVTLIGHSLGGYFVLHHMLASIENNKNTITNYIAASPSLAYADFILNDRLKELSTKDHSLKMKLYASMGTLEYDPESAPNQFLILKKELESFSQTSNLKVRAEEYSNFHHMEAAIPGFMKGLYFVLVED